MEFKSPEDMKKRAASDPVTATPATATFYPMNLDDERATLVAAKLNDAVEAGLVVETLTVRRLCVVNSVAATLRTHDGVDLLVDSKGDVRAVERAAVSWPRWDAVCDDDGNQIGGVGIPGDCPVDVLGLPCDERDAVAVAMFAGGRAMLTDDFVEEAEAEARIANLEPGDSLVVRCSNGLDFAFVERLADAPVEGV